MSTVTDEDTELRDLVATTLDNCGILGKMKAQLRANVYIALEQGDNIKKKSPLVNHKLLDFLSSTNGRLVASLVREFLVFFDLDFTLAVFDPETNIGHDFKYRGREKLIDALGLTELTDTRSPLLSEIMRLSKVSILKSETPTPTNEDDVDDEDGTSIQSSLAEDDVVSESKSKSVSERSSGSRTLTDNNKPTKTGAEHSATPDNSITDKCGSKNPPKSQNATFTMDPRPKSMFPSKEKELSPFQSGSLSSLGDLPPLGGHNVLGDLPPLPVTRANPLSPLEPHGRGSLAPLKKVPSMQKQDSDESNLSNNSNKRDLSQDISNKTDFPHDTSKKRDLPQDILNKRDLPQFGFEKDHVISESDSSSLNLNLKKQELVKKQDSFADKDDPASVEEDIEEELDSFLNSSVSAADDFTKDEAVLNSDISLKADYLESL